MVTPRQEVPGMARWTPRSVLISLTSTTPLFGWSFPETPV
jgi:hypothetical protein